MKSLFYHPVFILYLLHNLIKLPAGIRVLLFCFGQTEDVIIGPPPCAIRRQSGSPLYAISPTISGTALQSLVRPYASSFHSFLDAPPPGFFCWTNDVGCLHAVGVRTAINARRTLSDMALTSPFSQRRVWKHSPRVLPLPGNRFPRRDPVAPPLSCAVPTTKHASSALGIPHTRPFGRLHGAVYACTHL